MQSNRPESIGIHCYIFGGLGRSTEGSVDRRQAGRLDADALFVARVCVDPLPSQDLRIKARLTAGESQMVADADGQGPQIPIHREHRHADRSAPDRRGDAQPPAVAKEADLLRLGATARVQGLEGRGRPVGQDDPQEGGIGGGGGARGPAPVGLVEDEQGRPVELRRIVGAGADDLVPSVRVQVLDVDAVSTPRYRARPR